MQTEIFTNKLFFEQATQLRPQTDKRRQQYQIVFSVTTIVAGDLKKNLNNIYAHMMDDYSSPGKKHDGACTV